MLFKIAWRNIWRNKTRSIVVIAAVAAGLFAGMFMMAFFGGVVKQEVETAVQTQLAHIQIHHPLFPEDKGLGYAIPNGMQLLHQLQTNPVYKGVSGRVITTGMISSAADAAGVEIQGIDPETEQSVSNVFSFIKEGSYFTAGKKNEIVVGQKLADKLRLILHGKVVLTVLDRDGNLTAGSFRITGIFRSNYSTFDEFTVFIRREESAALLHTVDQIHEIALLLKNGDQSDQLARQLAKQYPGLLVQSWKVLSPEMAMLSSMFDQIMYIIIGIILLALMFGIINTMLMAVLERQREFGVMMAIGMNKARIFLMIVLETVLLTCAGIPLGILFTIAAVEYSHKYGIDLSGFSKGLSQYGIGNLIYPELQTNMLLPIIAMTAITALLASLYPAKIALKYKPATAIHKM